MTQLVGEEAAVRPFRINVPEEDLVDLRRRILATRCGGEESGSSTSPSASTTETTSASLSTPEGPGSVSGAPNLEFLAPYREDGGDSQ